MSLGALLMVSSFVYSDSPQPMRRSTISDSPAAKDQQYNAQASVSVETDLKAPLATPTGSYPRMMRATCRNDCTSIPSRFHSLGIQLVSMHSQNPSCPHQAYSRIVRVLSSTPSVRHAHIRGDCYALQGISVLVVHVWIYACMDVCLYVYRYTYKSIKQNTKTSGCICLLCMCTRTMCVWHVYVYVCLRMSVSMRAWARSCVHARALLFCVSIMCRVSNCAQSWMCAPANPHASLKNETSREMYIIKHLSLVIHARHICRGEYAFLVSSHTVLRILC